MLDYGKISSMMKFKSHREEAGTDPIRRASLLPRTKRNFKRESTCLTCNPILPHGTQSHLGGELIP